MNLNDLGFHTNNRIKKKAFKVVYLHQPTASLDRKCKASTTTDPTTKSSVQWASSTRHDSITAASNATSETMDDCGVIVAITEGRGEATCEIGICAMNTHHPELTLFQISDTNSYIKILNKVHLLNPSEILLPITFSNNRLVDVLKNTFQTVKILALDRSVFRKSCGLQFVKDVCSPTYNSVYIILQNKYYALTAAGALRMYLEVYKRLTYAKETLKVNYSESEYNTMIDVFAADKLELVACALGRTRNSLNRKHSSLRGILNHCLTKLGSRMLRSNILQPPNVQTDIENRLDCVEELYKCPKRLMGIRDILRKLSNFGQVLSLATVLKSSAQQCDERQMNYILQLNEFFDELEPLKELMASSTSDFFHRVHDTLCCKEFNNLENLFKGFIHDEARPAFGEQAMIARCFAIKSGQSEILDVLRKKYSDRLEEMRNHVKEVAEATGYDFKLGNNVRKGYHIVLQLGPKYRRSFKASTLPSYFCQIDEMATMVTMKTIKLLTLTNRLNDTCTEIIIVSNVLVYNLLLEIQKHIWRFYEMCEQLATLDVLQSLAQTTAAGQNYVRPKFDTFTKVIDGRHPLLEYLLETGPVPNHIFASAENRLHLITGSNGSGKSIYIRQIVLLQIMAQVGCFVPATKATFKICDRILARIFFEDNMDCEASAFILEMKEMKYFFNVITDRTLIIIDELCRSTALREGTALAMAICEYLLKSPAVIYFTTHYTYITRLQQLYPAIRCWQLETKEIYQDGLKPRLQFTHKVIPGVVTLEAYGLALARTIWPDVITNDVENLLSKLNDISVSTSVDKRIALKINLENELADMKRNGVCFKYPVYIKCLKYKEELAKLGISINFQVDDEQQDNAKDSKKSKNSPNNTRQLASNNHNHNNNDKDDTNEDGDAEVIFAEAVYSKSEESLKNNLNNSSSSQRTNINRNVTNKSLSSKFTEISYINQRKRAYSTIMSPVRNQNQTFSMVVNSTICSSQNSSFEIDENPHVSKKQRTLEDIHALNYFDDNLPFVSFPNENVLHIDQNCNNEFAGPDFFNCFPDPNNANTTLGPRSLLSQKCHSDALEIFERGSQINQDRLILNCFEDQAATISFSEAENSFHNISFCANPGTSKMSQLDSNQPDFFNFNQPERSFFNINVEDNQNKEIVDVLDNQNQVDTFFDDQNHIFNASYAKNPPTKQINFSNHSSQSDSLTSNKFFNGLQPENASTPLPLNESKVTKPKQFIDKKPIHVEKRTTKANWPFFEDDINDALSLIDQELISETVSPAQTKPTSIDPSSCNQYTTHLENNVLNLRNSLTATTKTKTSQTLVQSTSEENNVCDLPNSSMQGLNANTSSDLEQLPRLMENSHITENNTEATSSTEKPTFRKTRKFQPPVTKHLNQWTKREIQENFNKIRLDVLQSKNPIDVEAYCNEMCNRPSVKQIQASKVILARRKISNGKYVTDITSQSENGSNYKTGKLLKNVKRFKPPLISPRKFERSIKFDSRILSDNNLTVFDQIIDARKDGSGQGCAQGANHFQFSRSSSSK